MKAVNTTTPETFDFADWFGDANLPENSADVYTNAALVGEIEDLRRQLDLEDRVDESERTIGSKRTSSLGDRYIALAKQFTDSRVTVYVRALTSTERKEIRAAHEEAKEANEEFVFRSVAASVVGLKRAEGERQAAQLSVEQVRDLYARIGDVQIAAIHNAQLEATNGMPSVDADFLRKLSGPSAGPES